MAPAGYGRTAGSSRGRGRGRGRPRRPPTWEISDSDTEGPASAEAAERARDPAAEALRLLRPEQALRRLAVRVDPAILEDAGADVLMEALEALGCEHRVEPQRPARSLRWSRVLPEVGAAEEQDLLLLLEPEEFLRGVAQLIQASGPACPLPWFLPEVPSRRHLAVIGLDAYLWSRQPITQGTQQPESPEVAHAKVTVGWPEVEEALVHLQLWANVDVLLVASWQELSRHVCAVTRALAQCPFKQSQAFSFCTAGRWAAGTPVTRDGAGLRRAWWKQIRQFNRALKACSTEQERMGLLADLPVKASDGARPRRVGPDLSRRVYLFLTTTNPDLLLDLGS